MEIPITKGYSVQVSPEDYDFLMQWKWQAGGNGARIYADRSVRNGRSIRKLSLHRVVAERMGISLDGMMVDHADGNTLNCQRSNIRAATVQNNARNRLQEPGRFKGVWQRKDTGKWRARIKIDGKFKVIGSFETPEAAAIAYNKAAIEYFGEFASLNHVS